MANQMMLTKENRNNLPALYSTDGQGMNAVAQVKFFRDAAVSIFITEYDGNDTMFGYITGTQFPEWGYFSLSELTADHESNRLGRTERDYYFTPKTVGEALN